MSEIQMGNGSSGQTGGNYKKKKFAKLKDGQSIYRILPALGDAVARNVWQKYYNVHYGYKNTQGHLRVFQSPLRKNKQMIESPDAALQFIDDVKAEIARQKAAGAPKSIIDQLEEVAGGRKSRFNLDSNHYLNAIDTEGNVVILKIRNRAFKALDQLFKTLESPPAGSGKTPVFGMSPNDGRWIIFSRSGMGLDTTFACSVLQEEVDVPGHGRFLRDKVHSLTPEIIARLSSEAGNLLDLFKTPTSDEVALIVKGCDPRTGISAAVDAILDTKAGENSDEDAPQATIAQAAPQPNPAAVNMLASIQPQSQPAAVVTATVIAPTPITTTIVPPVAAAPVATPVAPTQAPVAGIDFGALVNRAPSAPVQPAAQVTRPAATMAESVTNMSETDFLASLMKQA